MGLWPAETESAAAFVTLAGDRHMGLKLMRESGSDGDISVHSGNGVTQQEQVIFANYIHAHLQTSWEQAQRLRHYVCPKCHVPKGNPGVLMKKLLRDKQSADTECDDCGERFPLWDALAKNLPARRCARRSSNCRPTISRSWIPAGAGSCWRWRWARASQRRSEVLRDSGESRPGCSFHRARWDSD